MKLFEIRSAPLYRNVYPFDFWFHVLKDKKDTIKAYQQHKIDGRTVKGTSFTRSKQLAFKNRSFGPVVLEVDQSKLSHTNKMIPVDAEYAHYLARNRRKGNDPVALRAWNKFNDRASGTGTHEMGAAMAEEFVVGDIHPLSRYLTQIIVFEDLTDEDDDYTTSDLPNYEDFKESLEAYTKQYSIPVIWK